MERIEGERGRDRERERERGGDRRGRKRERKGEQERRRGRERKRERERKERGRKGGRERERKKGREREEDRERLTPCCPLPSITIIAKPVKKAYPLISSDKSRMSMKWMIELVDQYSQAIDLITHSLGDLKHHLQ